jgi:NDP-sugar pyrophosphorylase family protein
MAKCKFNIFLPAAGLGERLRPVTNHLPKPLLPVLGRPLIGIILGKLSSVCDGRIGVNLHYKQELVLNWFKDSPFEQRVTFFPENPILGTGGAIKNAEHFLAGQPFLVHNADILLDIPFTRLMETHLHSGNIATLVTHRQPRLSNVVIDENDRVIDVENPGDSRPDPARIARKVAYTGVAVYSPEILQYLPAGASHMTTAWLAAARAGHSVKAVDFTGSYWSDVGEPASYAAALLDALQMIGETVYRSSGSMVGAVETDGYVVIERGSTVQDGSRLRNCIVMPGADVSGSHENAIIGPGYEIPLAEEQMQPSAHTALARDVGLAGPLYSFFDPVVTSRTGSIAKAVLIGLGGSDRRYFRVRKGALSAVLMECAPDDQDFERHIEYTTFFRTQGVPVPRLYGRDDRTRRALFEDLGDVTLYTALKFVEENEEKVETLYRQALDILVTLHGAATENVGQCPLLETRVFDYAHLRWETSYFFEHFVTGLRKAQVPDRKALNDEFHALAKTVSAFLPTIIHRDMQSQNIMVSKGAPRLIDYQGARMAPPAYDIASLLWDPYYRLDDDMRMRLLTYYREAMQAGSRDFDVRSFQDSIIPCCLQRHMQALGAYGFLSLVKGRKYFMKHVPEALRLLRADAEHARNEYPVLHSLVRQLT